MRRMLFITTQALPMCTTQRDFSTLCTLHWCMRARACLRWRSHTLVLKASYTGTSSFRPHTLVLLYALCTDAWARVRACACAEGLLAPTALLLPDEGLLARRALLLSRTALLLSRSRTKWGLLARRVLVLSRTALLLSRTGHRPGWSAIYLFIVHIIAACFCWVVAQCFY